MLKPNIEPIGFERTFLFSLLSLTFFLFQNCQYASMGIQLPGSKRVDSSPTPLMTPGPGPSPTPIAIPSPIAITVAQLGYTTPQQPESLVTVNMPSAQTFGNTNLVAIGWNDSTADITTVYDSHGNSYYPMISVFRGASMSQAIFAANSIVGGNSGSISVEFDRPAEFVDLRVSEFTGLHSSNPFLRGASASGVGSLADSGPVSFTTVPKLIFSAAMTRFHFVGPGLGFLLDVITNPDGDLVQHQIAIAPGTYSATAPSSGGEWLIQMVILKPSFDD